MFAAMFGGPAMPAAQAPVTPPISFSASAEGNALRVDLVIPSETIGTLVQTFRAMQGGPGMGPQAAPTENFEEGDF